MFAGSSMINLCRTSRNLSPEDFPKRWNVPLWLSKFKKGCAQMVCEECSVRVKRWWKFSIGLCFTSLQKFFLLMENKSENVLRRFWGNLQRQNFPGNFLGTKKECSTSDKKISRGNILENFIWDPLGTTENFPRTFLPTKMFMWALSGHVDLFKGVKVETVDWSFKELSLSLSLALLSLSGSWIIKMTSE